MKTFRLVLLAFACVAIGYIADRFMTANKDIEAVQRVVAMRWGDGKYGKAFYGAEVYLVPAGARYSVRGRIWIGRGNNYCHDLGELGTVAAAEDAVAKWGDVQWNQSDVTIGPGDPNPVALSCAKLESHR